MSSAIQLARDDPRLIKAIRRSRKLIGRKALIAAAASTVPLPGIDWAADAALLSRLIPQISQEFGLAPTQIERLAPHKQERIQQAVGMVGALLVGRLVTRDLLITLAKHAGMRLTAKQATKYAAGRPGRLGDARLCRAACAGRAPHQGLRAGRGRRAAFATTSTFFVNRHSRD